MEIKKGDVVVSTAGRDKGTLMIVFDTIGTDRVLLADGTFRRTDRPKLKKIKHILKLNIKSKLICDRMEYNEKIPNALLRREMKRINKEFQEEEF